jgi:hypothetical protein
MSPWWWRQQWPLKRWWTSTRLHGTTTQNTAIFRSVHQLTVETNTCFWLAQQCLLKILCPSKYLLTDKAFHKGRIIFKQYIPMKYKCFGIKLYKLCDRSNYKWHESLFNKWQDICYKNITATHATVKHLTEKVNEHGKLFPSPDLLTIWLKKISCQSWSSG